MRALGKLRVGGVIARGVALSMMPGGRALVAAEAEVQSVRLFAQAVGLPDSRVDEVFGEVVAEAAEHPDVVPVPELARRARGRLAAEALVVVFDETMPLDRVEIRSPIDAVRLEVLRLQAERMLSERIAERIRQPFRDISA